MRFVAFGGEKSLADLVEAHYGTLSAADARRAEKLVLEANPQLKTLRDVPRGAVLRLPLLVSKRAGAAPAGEDTAIRLETYAELLARFAEDLRTAIDVESEALKGDQRIPPEVKKVIEQVPEVQPLFEEVRRGLKNREERLGEARDLLKSLPAIRATVEKMHREQK